MPQINTKLPNDHKILSNGHNIFQICVKYVGIPTFSILRPSKIYPNWDFWFENIPSGNPAFDVLDTMTILKISGLRSPSGLPDFVFSNPISKFG
jgi:hypothetical protein